MQFDLQKYGDIFKPLIQSVMEEMKNPPHPYPTHDVWKEIFNFKEEKKNG